jgi:vomeronasal1 receptor
VVMYWVDFIISSISVLLWMYDPVILRVQKFVMYAFPTISPLVQISSDNRIIVMLKHVHLKHHQSFFWNDFFISLKTY